MSGAILNVYLPAHYEGILKQAGDDVNPTKLVRCLVRYLTEHWGEYGSVVATGKIPRTPAISATVRITSGEVDALNAVLVQHKVPMSLGQVVRRSLYLIQVSAEDLDRYLPSISQRASRVRADAPTPSTPSTPSTASGAPSGHWWWLTDDLNDVAEYNQANPVATRREAAPFTSLPLAACAGRRIVAWTCDPAQVAAFLAGRPLDEAKITRP